MHGKIFVEFKKFVEDRMSSEAWGQVVKDSGVAPRVYMPLGEHPDSEMVSLVAAASRMSGKSVSALLEGFGEFIAPELLRMYWALIRPEWKTLDVLENTEQTIHSVVRLKNPGARPPELSVKRVSPEEVQITYTSARKMCALAKGIARGVARHYNENAQVLEDLCMNKGSGRCQISVRIVS